MKKIFDIVLYLLLLIVFIVSLIVIFDKKETNDDDIKYENATNENVYYNCTKSAIKQNNYTISNNYNFSFNENKLNETKVFDIIKFDNKKAYDDYVFNVSGELKYKEESDSKELTKTYTLYYSIPQKTDGDSALTDYLKLLEEQGWKCIENKNTTNYKKKTS